MTRAAALPDVDRKLLDLPEPTPADPVHGWRTLRARTQAWVWRHRLSLLVVVPLLLVVAAVRWWGIGHGPALGDDEGTYVAQAWAVQVRHGLAPYTYWYDHPPLGWIQIAGFTWVTGVFGAHGLAVVAVRKLMLCYAVADAGLIYVLGRRLGLNRFVTAGGVLLWALSPLAVGYSRMVYLDNIGVTWALAAFVFAATRRYSLWAHVGAGLCFAAAVLSKETILLLLPALIVLAWQHTTRQTRSFCLSGFATALLLGLACYPLLAILKGELLPGRGHVSMLQALQFQLFTRPSSGSIFATHSAARGFLDQWLALDGWLLLLGLMAVPVCLLVRRYAAIGLAVAIPVVTALRPGYLPQPFVIALLPFCALAAACAAQAIGSRVASLRPARDWSPVAGRAVAAACGISLLAALLPGYVSGDRALAASDQSQPVAAAEHWLEAHRSVLLAGSGRTHKHVLVDDTMWADLVTHGYPQSAVTWFYKLDYVNNLDPSVRRVITSTANVAAVVSTPIVRSALAQAPARTYPVVRQALAASRVVATFGTGTQRIEIRVLEPRKGASS